MRVRPWLIAGAACVVCGCASSPLSGTEPRRDAVQVYATNPFVGKQYEVIGSLWGGSWRSALRIPAYPNRDEAVAALQAEATRLNADALVSVSCLDQGPSTWFRNDEPAFICYGVAIRLPRSQG